MTAQEVIQEIQKFPIAEQVALLREIFEITKENPEHLDSHQIQELEKQVVAVEQIYRRKTTDRAI